jgi:hypothetical protein
MYEYSEEDSLLERIKKYIEGNLKKKKKKLAVVCQKVDVEKNIE